MSDKEVVPGMTPVPDRPCCGRCKAWTPPDSLGQDAVCLFYPPQPPYDVPLVDAAEVCLMFEDIEDRPWNGIARDPQWLATKPQFFSEDEEVTKP